MATRRGITVRLICVETNVNGSFVTSVIVLMLCTFGLYLVAFIAMVLLAVYFTQVHIEN